MSRADKPTVFVSYSHRDEEWKNRLRPHLKMLEQAGLDIVIWDDRDIDAGAQWYNEIKQAMDRATAAVCLISADYLASDFCNKEEIPYLLELRERAGMLLLPVLVRPCVWKAATWLEKTQMLPRDGKTVTKDFKDNEDEVFALVAETIFDALNNPDYRPPAPPPSQWSPPDKLDITRLPVTGAELFGRQKDLELLDAAWDDDNTNVVSLVAWGGVGKSTLVNKWLERMDADNYRGARRVYAWSFYSQGTGERVTSADQFINAALLWFGDTDPTAGSPWDKGERLARLVRESKTLLLLDGLEPLQSPHAHERGKIKDPALLTLLNELARSNPGLCLITTRERVTDLAEYEAIAQQEGDDDAAQHEAAATVRHKDLEQISDEAGRALLRVGGVQGTDAELEQAVRDFGNHALAINLLAVYLRDVPNHHVSHAAQIPDLDIPEASGKHPRRLMAAFVQRFGPGPEVELLRVLGLFDRPADDASLRALRSAPPISDLTDHLHALLEADWLRLLEKLRRSKLIAPTSHHGLADLDAHPLLREHFGQELKQQHPAAWRAGNRRLYKHLRDTAKELPDTLEEMAPLYAAIAHGCEAGMHEEALGEIFWRRVCRGERYFSTKNLGAFGAYLTALSGFFDLPWQKPVSGLTEIAKAVVLGEAGYTLQMLARSKESTQPLLAALKAAISDDDWGNAAIRASNLSETYLSIGDLPQALSYAQWSVDFADRSGVKFQQITKRTRLASSLHQAGRWTEAENAFSEAEKMQEEFQPEYPLLYALQGFQYCDLLLNQGKYHEVQARVERTLTWITPMGWPLYIALDYLSWGRAYLLQAQQEATGNFAQATGNLKRAVDELRQAGSPHFLPLGLIARANLYRLNGEFDLAKAYLDEAMSIATRGEIGLYQADCYLEYARFHLAQDAGYKARESWAKAREMIERMGYHRRDGDVREIDAQLKAAGV